MAKKRKSTAQYLIVGKAFLKYLKEKNPNQTFGKNELADIFRNGYKESPTAVDCRGFSFSTLLYTLRVNGMLKFKKGEIHITSGIYARDQYSTLKKHALDKRASKYPFYCEDCDVKGNSLVAFRNHLNGKKHLQQMSLKYLKSKRDKFTDKNLNGIKVTSTYDKDNGAIAFGMKLNSSKRCDIKVINTSSTTHLLVACLVLKAQPAISLDGHHDNVQLLPGKESSISTVVKSECIGIIQSPVLFAFKPADDNAVFQIMRFLKVEVKGEIGEELPPTVPYERPTRESLRRAKGEIVEGVPPLLTKSSKLKMINLKMYLVPSHLRYQINNKNEVEEVERNMELPLTWENYSRRFSDLLHVEECQMEVDIRRYDINGATMKQDGKFLKLKVPGLAENRPSVLRGDYLFARFTDDRSNPQQDKVKTYKGYVHHVELEEVVLGFSQEFLVRFTSGIKVDIEFTFSRFPLRLQHFALEEAPEHPDLRDVLFPQSGKLGGKPPLCTVQDPSGFARILFDQKLTSNSEQVQAIQHILQGTSRPAPYLVFGPPGTGKTVTIVEAIKQVYKHFPSSRILACAPSNSATDLIANRLLTGTGTPIAVTTLFRLNALSRDWKKVDQALKDKGCCNYDKMSADNFFPAKEEIIAKRIVVATLCTSGRLATTRDFPYDHFTHVFIDEAGHAVEPEALIAMANLLNPNNPSGGQVVLAGDPKQLGPILRSPLALEHGLELSLLERLMKKCDVYKRRKEEPHYDSHVLTKLLRNYRSHPAILKLPNRMFYKNELKICADKLVRESLCRWEKLPQKDFPIIFHGVEGVDDREGQSPSFFNKAEIEIVVEYVLELKNKRGGMRVKESDIGVISPYRRQVQKIKEVLKKRKINDVKVGSVEEFQGQERLIIIVSTVRSTKPEYIQMDIDYMLGFVKNPKRLNVAMTRAKALLILVGNPYMLSKDANWSMFLEYCLDNKAYTGCFFQNEDEELDDTIDKFQKLEITADIVDKPIEERLGMSAVTEQHDPEWRNEDA